MALKHIKLLKEPTVKILNNVLSLKARINKKHFELCVSLYKNPITLDLPIPHTDKISNFSKVAGVENLDSLRKSGKFVPGCYRIYGIGNSPGVILDKHYILVFELNNMLKVVIKILLTFV